MVLSRLKSLPSLLATKALSTLLESVDHLIPTRSLDGIGSFWVDSNTIRLLLASAVAPETRYSYKFANGLSLSCSQIQYFDVNKSGKVVRSGIGYDAIIKRSVVDCLEREQVSFLEDSVLGISDSRRSSPGHSCCFAADESSPSPDEVDAGRADSLSLACEDLSVANGNGDDSVMAVDVKNNVLYTARDLQRFSVNQALVVDRGFSEKVGFFVVDDSTPGPAWIDGGRQDVGGTDDLALKGLKVGQLYIWDVCPQVRLVSF
jgi:hypothetical protein